jgi:hypothetical protein
MNHSMLAATAPVVGIADLETRFAVMLQGYGWLNADEMEPFWNELSVADLELAAMYFMAKANQKASQLLLTSAAA